MENKFIKFKGDVKTSYTIEFAPNGMSKQECLDNGYKMLIENHIQPQDGYTEILDQVIEDAIAFLFIYKRIPIPQIKPNRSFSKYKLISLCMKQGIWESIKQEIDANGLMDLFNAALVFKEDDEFFKRGLQFVQTKLKYTDEQVKSILDACASDD